MRGSFAGFRVGIKCLERREKGAPGWFLWEKLMRSE
jgi:hypothetical protein